MKILFVCKSNFARSQMAEELFNKYTKKHSAISAGTSVEKEWFGKALSLFPNHVIEAMKEEYLDLSKNKPKQLTQKMTEEVERIIVLAQKDHCPDYLLKSKKTIFWDVPDPRGQDLEFHRKVRDLIKIKVKDLINKISF